MKATLKGVRVVATSDPEYFVVGPEWDGVDRPYTYGWEIKKKLVKRLTSAIEGEAAKLCVVEIRTDINGETYVSFDLPAMGRTMNADLKRLGY